MVVVPNSRVGVAGQHIFSADQKRESDPAGTENIPHNQPSARSRFMSARHTDLMPIDSMRKLDALIESPDFTDKDNSPQAKSGFLHSIFVHNSQDKIKIQNL
jgi:hypothetical protein